jgi:hypothetical protein
MKNIIMIEIVKKGHKFRFTSRNNSYNNRLIEFSNSKITVFENKVFITAIL